MEVDEIEESNSNSKQMNENQNPNPTNPSPTIQSNNKNKNDSNSMEIDTDNTSNNSNKARAPNTIMACFASAKQSTKRRKKRKRDEMEVDSGNTPNKSNNNTNNKNTTTNSSKLPTSSIIKKRKISTLNSSKTPTNSTIEPMPQKWQDKYKEYSANIIQHFSTLKSINNPNRSLLESEETQSELKKFQTNFEIFITSQTSENTKINIKNFNFDEYINLISKLSYARTEGLTDLSLYVRDTLISNKQELKSILSCLDVRQFLLKSCERKLYGIKPVSKTINKTEEKILINQENLSWKKCRLYVWECLNMKYIPKQYVMDTKEIRNLNTMISKYGAFCKKYDQLLHKKGCKTADKNKQLQKIDDGIVSWFSKQEQMEKQRLMKEEAIKKKREAREQQMKEKKEKREEMERLKKEKLAEKQKQKEEKLKKEKERKEKLEKERLERKQKKEQLEKEKKERKEKLEKERKEKKEQLEKERKEKKEKQEQLKLQKIQNSKTPKIKNKKKRASFMDNWVKVTKYQDTMNEDTPIIKDKTVSLSSGIGSDPNSRASSISPTVSPNKNDTRTLYEKMFKKPKIITNIINTNCPKYTQQQYPRLQKVIISGNCYFENISLPKPTVIPSVIIDTIQQIENDNDENNGNDEQNPIDLTLENDLSRMQIDDETEIKEHEDIDMNDNEDTKLKLQWKYREFNEDYRPSFFGVNKYKKQGKVVDIDIKKLCRSPLYRLNVDKKVVNYDSDDSGVEYYDDDGDDLDGEDLDDFDEDEEALVEEIRNQQQRGLIRSDGFENDGFLLNDDDDDDEAVGDREVMGYHERNKKLKDKLKDEYPIKFIHQRQRADQYDEPIRIQLPEFGKIQIENVVLYGLMQKKGMIAVMDEVEVEHDEKCNDIEYLLEIENKNNDMVDKSKDKDDKEKKKKKKKDKKDKKKEKENKNDENGMNVESKKMECDDDDEEDEDDDIKMKGDNKPKLPKQNTLTKYFGKANKEKSKEPEKEKVDEVKDVKPQEPKKKKRRIVMCELVE